MARKTLLTESEVRQFMKLANLVPLGVAKIEEMYGDAPGNRDKEDHKKEMTEADMDEEGGEDVHEKPVAEEVEDLEEMGMAYDRDEDEVEDDVGMEMDAAADDMGDAEMDMDAAEDDMDMGMDDDMGAMGGDEKEELMADVVRAVAQALGIEDQVSVEAGEEGMEGGDDLDTDMPAMDTMDEPAPEEPEMAMGGDEEEDEIDVMAEESEDDLVAEVARRVAARLQTQNRKEQVVDALAERIMKRLTK